MKKTRPAPERARFLYWPAIIITSALSGGLGFIALPAAQFFGWLAWLPVSYLLVIVNAFAALPSAFIEIDSFHPGIVGGYYLALALGVWFYRRSHRTSILTTQYISTAQSNDEQNR